MRKTERFTKQQVAGLSGSFETGPTGKMLEVARRQGLISSSFVVGPNGERERLYHSWDYVEPELDFQDAPSFTEAEKEPDDENPAQEQVPQEEPIPMVTNENLPAREDEDDWF
jgi:hypothetical protein